MRLSDLTKLADGPVATVYAGWRNGAPVAVKLFPKRFDKRTLAAFTKEQAVLSGLRRPASILTIDAVDEIEGHVALRTELCSCSLASIIERGGPLPPATVIALGRAVALTLEVAHDAGVVHGGLSPHNVLFRTSGEPVMSDFGLTLRQALVRDPLHAIEFLPPETLRTGVLNKSTDLYSLGALLHYALDGRSPHPGRLGEQPGERVLRILGEPVPAISVSGVPVALTTLVARLLASDPSHRPDDAAQVVAHLVGLLPEGAGQEDPFDFFAGAQLATPHWPAEPERRESAWEQPVWEPTPPAQPTVPAPHPAQSSTVPAPHPPPRTQQTPHPAMPATPPQAQRAATASHPAMPAARPGQPSSPSASRSQQAASAARPATPPTPPARHAASASHPAMPAAQPAHAQQAASASHPAMPAARPTPPPAQNTQAASASHPAMPAARPSTPPARHAQQAASASHPAMPAARPNQPHTQQAASASHPAMPAARPTPPAHAQQAASASHPAMPAARPNQPHTQQAASASHPAMPAARPNQPHTQQAASASHPAMPAASPPHAQQAASASHPALPAPQPMAPQEELSAAQQEARTRELSRWVGPFRWNPGMTQVSVGEPVIGPEPVRATEKTDEQDWIEPGVRARPAPEEVSYSLRAAADALSPPADGVRTELDWDERDGSRSDLDDWGEPGGNRASEEDAESEPRGLTRRTAKPARPEGPAGPTGPAARAAARREARAAAKRAEREAAGDSGAGRVDARRWWVFGAVGGGALVGALSVVLVLVLGGDPDELTSTPQDPGEGGLVVGDVRVELSPPVDRNDEVELRWQSTRELDFAVVVAAEGEKADVLLANRKYSMTVDVEPGLKYCLMIQGTDGERVYESQPVPLRGATCRK